MEIYQLRAFVTVASLGQVTRAAEALHVTQPAVTAQIKALEEELGLSLFDRRPGRNVLTKQGETILNDATQVLVLADMLLGKAKKMKGKVTGQLIIGTLGDPDSLRLGSLLNCMLETLPLLDIKTRHGHSEELHDLVAAGAIHCAFYIGQNIPCDVVGIQLQTIYYRVAAPLSLRHQVLHADWSEIAAMSWIGAPAQHHMQILLKDMFGRQGLVPTIVIESDESSSPQSLVRSGVGVALLREDIAFLASERDEVVIWPHTRVSAVLCFIYPKAAENSPAVVAALSQVKSVWDLVATSTDRISV